jgi:hypothetical protein
MPNFNDKLWIRVAFPPSAAPGVVGTSFDEGTLGISGSFGQLPAIQDSTLFGVSNPANVPFGLINYDSLNPWAKWWIFEYTLACSRETLGLIRSKFKNFPIPNAELTLNGEDLVAQGREDKETLLNGDGGLTAKLEALTYDKLAELELARAKAMAEQIQLLPMPPREVLSVG